MARQEARSEFSVHLLNDTGIGKAAEIADAFSDLLDKLETIIPAGRERSLVVTKLQEAAFWAKRGMSVNPSHHVDS
jgi:hypothetical protein